MKKTPILILCSIFLIFIAPFVFSAEALPTCTFVTPSSGANVNGTQLFNVTVNHGNYSGNVTRVNFSSDVDGQLVGRTSLNQSNYNLTYSTSSLTDGAHTITATIFLNETYSTGNTCTRSITSDNSVPVCTRVSAEPSEAIRKGSQLGFTVTATDTTAITYSTVLTLYDSTAYTLSGATNTFTSEQTNVGGRASLVTTLTDAVSKSTTCSTVDIDITSDGTSQAVASSQIAKKTDNKGMYMIVFVVFVSLIVVLLSMGMMKKKKRR